MPARRRPPTRSEPNFVDLLVYVEEVLTHVRPVLLALAEGWMSVTEAAHELQLTPPYVQKLFVERKLAGYVNRDGEVCICAHHVAAERARRMASRRRHRR